MNRRSFALLFLRVSLGWFLAVWGIDKLVNVSHGLAVSKHFYFGLFDSELLLKAFGVLELIVAVLVIVGIARRITYPFLLAITGATLLAVWRSVIDPWGWWLQGSDALFFPSLIIFAAALTLWALDETLQSREPLLAAGPPSQDRTPLNR